MPVWDNLSDEEQELLHRKVESIVDAGNNHFGRCLNHWASRWLLRVPWRSSIKQVYTKRAKNVEKQYVRRLTMRPRKANSSTKSFVVQFFIQN